LPPFPEYDTYPPRNRTDKPLNLPQIEVTDANGKIRTTPNALIGCVIWGASGEQPTDRDGRPVNDIGDGQTVFNPLALVPRADVPSLLSGEPSVRYVADDVSIDLTPEELLRFISRELTEEEYFKVRNHFGMMYEIFSDYYDTETGRSRRPRR
jgi:hypothetical protein